MQVLSEAETANILAQVVNGLLYLKSNHILHRDMSLSNLLLTNELKVKIADFGLATQLTRPDERHTTLCGTPNYISPEVASRAAHGLPVDVWGLGCMMYTLLVGKPPFDTDGVKSTLTKVVMADFVVPSYLSMEAKDLLNRLLRKNPVERIHIDDVLTHPFMLKYMVATTPKFNQNAIVSVDSGLLTMSSGTISTQNITGKIEHGRSRSEERVYYQQKREPLKTNNVFGVLNGGHSNSSLYNHHDSQYDIYNQQQQQQQQQHYPVQTNDVIDRFENMALVQPAIEKPVFGVGLPKPTFSNTMESTESLGKHQPLFKENRFYGNQQNNSQPQLNNHVFEPVIATKQQNTKEKSNTKLSVPPLKSDRLLPTRFKTKNAILSILTLGEVVVEMIKFKAKYNEDRVVDVCRISKDGLRIVVYQPDAGR